MPTYDYHCEKCKKKFSVFRKITEKTEKCIHCDSKEIKQTITSSQFVLKGKGWFKDGY